jgi:hypothetical protein
MKRGIVLIIVLLCLVDLAQDGCLGSFKFVPLQATISTSLSSKHHYPSRQADLPHLLVSHDWLDMFSPNQSQQIKDLGQFASKIITSCHIGGSGGIPL